MSENHAELLAECRRVLTEVHDGNGCQPGYINTMTLSRVRSLLSRLPSPGENHTELLAECRHDAAFLNWIADRLVGVYKDRHERECPLDSELWIRLASPPRRSQIVAQQRSPYDAT